MARLGTMFYTVYKCYTYNLHIMPGHVKWS